MVHPLNALGFMARIRTWPHSCPLDADEEKVKRLFLLIIIYISISRNGG